MRCEVCNHEMQIGEFPFCPHSRGHFGAIGDDIPGGVEIRHGLCDPVTGAPRRYYSHSEIAREAKARGFENRVRHIDGSRVTNRWI